MLTKGCSTSWNERDYSKRSAEEAKSPFGLASSFLKRLRQARQFPRVEVVANRLGIEAAASISHTLNNVQVLQTGGGVKYYHLVVRFDPFILNQAAQRGDAGRTFRAEKNTFGFSD